MVELSLGAGRGTPKSLTRTIRGRTHLNKYLKKVPALKIQFDPSHENTRRITLHFFTIINSLK